MYILFDLHLKSVKMSNSQSKPSEMHKINHFSVHNGLMPHASTTLPNKSLLLNFVKKFSGLYEQTVIKWYIFI